MGKRVPISWNKWQRKELKRAVDKYNKEVDKLWKKYPDASTRPTLPPKVNYNYVKDSIQTNAELKAQINSMKRLSDKKYQKPAKNGNLEYINHEFNVLRRTYNKDAKKRRDALEKEMQKVPPQYQKPWMASALDGADATPYPKRDKPTVGDLTNIRKMMGGPARYDGITRYIEQMWLAYGIHTEQVPFSDIDEIDRIYKRFIREKPTALTIIHSRDYLELQVNWFYHLAYQMFDMSEKFTNARLRWQMLEREFFDD